MMCASEGARLAVKRRIDMMELGLEAVDGRGERLIWQRTRAPIGRTQGRMAIVITGRK
jgi:hypothetical protein